MELCMEDARSLRPKGTINTVRLLLLIRVFNIYKLITLLHKT